MRVVVGEDSVLLREGLTRLLSEAGFEVVGAGGDYDEILRLVEKFEPETVVLDIRMPPSFTDEGLRVAEDLRRRHTGIGILILSQYIEVSYAARLMGEEPEGVGYLLKDRVSDVTELADAVRTVGSGGCVVDPKVVGRLLGRKRPGNELERLTDRERAVLGLMAEGRSNQSIALRLCMSDKTVESHVRSIFTKLDLPPCDSDHRRVLAVLRFLRISPAPTGEDATANGGAIR